MFKIPRGIRKKKQAKDGELLCLLQYIFSKQKQNRAIPFPIILLCYGSNSGVDSYTSIISRAANRNPIVNACNSCLSEISASVFSKNERLNAILIQGAESLHHFFIFHGILFVNKQKQEKYICLKLHIEKSGCHPLR